MAKHSKITVETDSLLILKARSSLPAWCPVCKSEAEMIAIENTAVIPNLEKTALQEWLNSGELHSRQAVNGSTLICLKSLLALVQNRNR